MEQWEVNARLSIARVQMAYAAAVDNGQADAFGACYARNGVMIGYRGQSNVGPAAITRYIEDVLSSRRAIDLILRHHNTPAHAVFQGEAEATAESYFAVFSPDRLDHWGKYCDRLIREDGMWLFASRRVEMEGADPDGWISNGGPSHARRDTA